MKINPYIFRGYDIRGEVGKDLDSEVVELIGKAFGTYLKKADVSLCVVGCDNRNSSQEYRQAIIKGLTSTGCDVVDLGLSLSPIVYWAGYNFKSKGVAMITGSHNPVEYNGFKLGSDYSSTLTETQSIKKLVLEKDFAVGVGKVTQAPSDTVEKYFDEVISKTDDIKKFKIVVDASNSTAGKFYPDLLRKAGCEVIEQNCELDGNFPSGTPDPTEEKVAKRLAERVVKEGADLGFSYDSDGDRIGIVDEKGGIIWNDVLVAIFADAAISKNPSAPIVYNALCSRVVSDVIEKEGGKGVMWLTGHSFIKQKAQEVKASFAGELSGHFYFLDRFYGHDDAGYASMQLLEYLTKKNKTLSEVVAGLPQYISSPEVKIGCPDEIKMEITKKMVKNLEQDFAGEKVTDIDGARIDFADGMIIVRASQNGPYLTVKYEAKDQETYEKRRQYVITLLKKYPEINWSEGVNLEQLQ